MSEEVWVERENLRRFTETIELACPSCKIEVILNRRDDIGRLSPLSRHQVTCPECDSVFFIGGDSCNAPHELLWLEGFRYKSRKRYTIALILLCQAYEMMFASAIRHILIFHLADESHLDVGVLNSLLERLYQSIRRHGYGRLRNCMIRLVSQETRPQSIEESELEIEDLHTNYDDPGDEWILDTCTDASMASLLIKLRRTNVNVLRNHVIHSNRYFPTLSDVQGIFDESEELLPLLSCKLGLSSSHWELARF